MVGIGNPLNLGEPALEIWIDVAALATNERDCGISRAR
jgi:hypothetical protein